MTVKQIVGMLRYEHKGNWLLVTVDGYILSVYWCDYYGQYADTLGKSERVVGYFNAPVKMETLRNMILNTQERRQGHGKESY